MNLLIKSISVSYRLRPKDRANKVIERLGEKGVKLDDRVESIVRDVVQREIEIDRGEGMNIKHNQELWDNAFLLWKMAVKEYLFRIFNMGSFSCPVCGEKIRTIKGHGSHATWCPFLSYKPDFITDDLEFQENSLT